MRTGEALNRAGAWASFAADRQGSIVVEFAMIFPIMLTLMVGMIEIGSYSLLKVKVEQSALNIAELITRSPALKESDVDKMIGLARHMLDPHPYDGFAAITVSGLVGDCTGANVAWQRDNGSVYLEASEVGTAGGAATLPASLTLADGQVLVAVEFDYKYEQRLFGILPSKRIEALSYFSPRLGSLATLQPG